MFNKNKEQLRLVKKILLLMLENQNIMIRYIYQLGLLNSTPLFSKYNNDIEKNLKEIILLKHKLWGE